MFETWFDGNSWLLESLLAIGWCKNKVYTFISTHKKTEPIQSSDILGVKKTKIINEYPNHWYLSTRLLK